MLDFYVVSCSIGLAKYRTLMMKMTLDVPTNDKAKTNFDLLCDVQILLGLIAILLLL
jgi:hypothetical protein